MKKIDRLIGQLSLEIVCITFMIIITYFMWGKFENKAAMSEAYAYSNYKMNLNLKINNDIFLAHENKENVNISIENYNKVEKEYNLYIRIDKEETTLDIDCLKLLFFNSVYNFNDLYSFDKGMYKYYKIYNNKISGKNKDIYEISILLDSNNMCANKNLAFNFEVEEF